MNMTQAELYVEIQMLTMLPLWMNTEYHKTGVRYYDVQMSSDFFEIVDWEHPEIVVYRLNRYTKKPTMDSQCQVRLPDELIDQFDQLASIEQLEPRYERV